ncbi:MAG: hypothetical protein ACTSYB_12565 [Candidatus Helarchaeota archaeon]
MQIRTHSISNQIEDNFEHIKIKKKLVSYFSYFDPDKEGWCKITNFSDPICNKNQILIRCRYAQQILRIPYPFKLEDDILYLWGLIVGSAKYSKRLRIRIDAYQKPLIQSIAERLGIQIQTSVIHRKRRKRGSKRHPNTFRKLIVTFPFVFKKFLWCLGYRQKNNTIPQWLTFDQQLKWLEGYLNSSKIQCSFNPFRVSIRFSKYNPRLFQNIIELLKHLSIRFIPWHSSDDRFGITIKNHSSIAQIGKFFVIRRPKLRALFALIHKTQENPALLVSLQKFKLSEFQLTLYGLILEQPAIELEYTIFEKIFACSSNEIRQNLYLLDKLGLITYYKRENNKEFLIQANRYIHLIVQMLKSEKRELCRQLKFTDYNALSFHCKTCDQIISYTEAMDGHTFRCPHCKENNLHPVELSRYFYLGHLGLIMQQQRALMEE